jgi:hypothetical protein
MDTCTVETGLLRKKTCGEPAVGKCANCEQPLCSKHRVPQTSGGRKTGGFLCPECAHAWRESEKRLGELPATPASALPPQQEKPAAERPAAPPPAARPAPAAQKQPQPPPIEESGPLEFTPEPKKPEEKK